MALESNHPMKQPLKRRIGIISSHAGRIVFAYLVVGASWILFSDAVVSWVAGNEEILSHIQTLKGLSFIGITATLLFFLIRHAEVSLADENQARRESEQRYRDFLNHNVAGTWQFEFRRPMPVSLSIEEQIEWTMDHGVLVECNDVAVKMYKLDAADDVLGKTYREIFSHDEQGTEEKLRIWAEGGHRLNGYESFERLRVGEDRWFLIMGHGVIEDDHLVRSWGTQIDITEHKKAQNALQESKERYQRLVEGIQDEYFIYSHNTEGVFTYVSPSITNVLGYETDTYFTHYSQTFTDNSINKVAMLHTEASIRGEQQPSYEAEVHHKDGGARSLEITEQPVFGNQGQVIAVEGIAHDITERKRAEEALHRERRLNEELFKTTPAFAVAINAEGKTVMMNDAMCHALGYTFDEVNGVDYVTTFVPENDRDDLAGVIRTLNTTAESTVSENLVLTRDGRELLVEWQGSQVFNTQGEFEFLFGVGIDITDRRRMEQALQESEQRYHSLYTSTNEGLALHRIIYDESGQALDYEMLDVNPAFESIVGMQREDVIGRRASDIYETGEAPYLETFADVARSGEPVSFETTFEPLGRSFRVAAFSPEKGRFATLFADITERIKAQDKLVDYQKRLRSLASEQSLTEEHERRKLAGYLHDGPCQQLAVCLLKMETLRSSLQAVDERSVVEVCQIIHQTVRDLRNLTFDLSPPTLYLVGLEAAIEELLKEELRDKHEILYDFKRAHVSGLLGDDLRALLFQSVRELLNNTVKYAQAKKVTVETRRNDNGVEVIVEDDGIGFDMSVIGSAVSKTGGYGLFSMRERLTHIGGQLDIRSHPGQGSRFSITVPLEIKE